MGGWGMAKTETSDSRLIEMVRGAGFSFGPVIVAEAGREGVPLALALALVEQESTFRNIFGCDQGRRKTVPWCHQHVTRDRVQALIAHVERGGTSNGVGLTQLTSIDLIRQAEAEGGAHTVDAQCRVGFRQLHGLIERHGELVGIGDYNGGEGNPVLEYADHVIGLRAKWQARINHALSGGAALGRDGQFGPHTLRASGRVAFALGLSDDACSVIKDGTVVQLTQQLIRHPSGLSAEDRQRASAREPELKRRYEAWQAGARAAVRWARLKARKRVHESPPLSNWGHPVQDWIKFTGYGGPVFWCGCFVAVAVVEKGGAEVPHKIRLGFDHYINADARNGENGFEREVSVNDAKPGDIATFNFRHIGLVVGPTRNGMIHTIEGNTSASDGSNNNGGEVAEHQRPVSEVTVV